MLVTSVPELRPGLVSPGAFVWYDGSAPHICSSATAAAHTVTLQGLPLFSDTTPPTLIYSRPLGESGGHPLTYPDGTPVDSFSIPITGP